MGVVFKLLEKDNSSSDDMSTNLSMLLIRQMEALIKSTDTHERQERIKERRERKHCKKCCAKKREKKMTKKAALEGQEDHEGKAEGGSSSDS